MTKYSQTTPSAKPANRLGERYFFIEGIRISAKSLAPGLHVVATPIGNLEDVTLRALHVLASADRIYCEDTRITRRLLDRYQIETSMSVYDDYASHRVREDIGRRIAAGQAIALVSDAGTPLISDPGFKLVRLLRGSGHGIFAIPGPSALTAAASIAGIASNRLCFIGFLPTKMGARRKVIEEFQSVPATLMLYESPRRLEKTLVDLVDILGPREGVIARELTKINEEVVCGMLDQLSARYAGAPVKGEIVILVSAAEPLKASPEELDAAIYVELESKTVRDAAAAVAARFSVSRRDVYDRALALKTQAPISGVQKKLLGDEESM